MKTEVRRALEIAIAAHDRQEDKAGKSYIFHPIWVALQMDTDDEKVVALLHDVLEDSDLLKEDLEEFGISLDLINKVEILTRKDNESYFDYINRIKTKEDFIAIKVKLADLFHNSDLSRLKRVAEKDLQRRDKYMEAIKILQK